MSISGFHFNPRFFGYIYPFILVRLRVKASLRLIAADPARTRVSTREKKLFFYLLSLEKISNFENSFMILVSYSYSWGIPPSFPCRRVLQISSPGASSIPFLLNAPHKFSFFKDSFWPFFHRVELGEVWCPPSVLALNPFQVHFKFWGVKFFWLRKTSRNEEVSISLPELHVSWWWRHSRHGGLPGGEWERARLSVLHPPGTVVIKNRWWAPAQFDRSY